jgi:tetratricopeptide (TPR) repeat protein
LRKSVDLFRRASQDFPDEAFLRQEHAYSQWLLGDLLEHAGRAPEAVEELRRAVEFHREAIEGFPSEDVFKQRAISCGVQLGNLLIRLEQYPEAEQACQQALRICATHGMADSPDCATATRSLARLSRLNYPQAGRSTESGAH